MDHQDIGSAFKLEEDCGEGSESLRSIASSLIVEEVTQSLVEGESESQQNSTEPQIVNIVYHFNVGCELDLKKIATKAWNVEYNPAKFPAVIMRLKKPKTTALISHNGEVIVTGATTEADVKQACRKYVSELQKLDFPAKVLHYRVVNMVALAKMPFVIDLIMLNAQHCACTRWEPEIFPGLSYNIQDPKMTFVVFQSGKVLLLGFTDRKVLKRGFELIHPVLVKYKKVLLN